MSEISVEADRMTDFLVGACVAFGRSGAEEMHVKLSEAITELHAYIESIESQLTSRDALIERLVEAGQTLADEFPYSGDNEKMVNEFDALSDEWEAIKAKESVK